MLGKFLLVALATLATIEATTVQVFSDSNCVTPTGPLVSINLQSMGDCQLIAPSSVFHDCSTVKDITRLFHQVYDQSNSCNSLPAYSFVSEGAANECVTTSAVGPNEHEIKGFVRISCDGQSNEAQPTDAAIAAAEIFRQIKSMQ